MIDRSAKLSVTRQAGLLGISRSSVYYTPRPVPEPDLALMRRIDELHLDDPFAGSRMMQAFLRQEGHETGRLHVATLTRRMGIEALYRRPNTSKPAPGHKVFPYLLRKLAVTRPNQVWATDITLASGTQSTGLFSAPPHPDGARLRLPRRGGGLVDPTGAVLAGVDHAGGRCSLRLIPRINRLTLQLCVEVVEEALARHGRPEIFNMEHGRAIGPSGHATSGQSVHLDGLTRRFGESRGEDQHGWQGSLARQCLHRAPLADHQIGGGLSAGLRQRPRGPSLDRALLGLLQHPQPAFVA